MNPDRHITALAEILTEILVREIVAEMDSANNERPAEASDQAPECCEVQKST